MDLTLGLLFLLPGFILAGNEANLGGGDNSQISDNMPFVFTSILFAPYLIQNPDSSAEGNDRYIGFIADLVKELATRLDFKYELKLVDDGKWGSRDSTTGKWNGMIGEVISGNSIMAAAPITMSATRKAVVDFADTFQDVSITALVHVDADFTSIDDVIAAKNWTLGRIKGSSTEAAIKSNMQYSGLWSAIASSKNSAVSTTEEGITRVLNSKFAFFMERPLAEYAIAQNCELKMVGQLDSQGGGYAFPLKKNNPKAMKLLSDINRGLQLIRDDGTLRHLEDEWWEHQTCSGTSLIASLTLSIVGALCTRLML